jgi:hypothetical protein
MAKFAIEHANDPERCRKLSEALTGRIGPLSTGWKGGRVVKRGYVLIWNKSHPHANAQGYVLEHRLVMEEKVGRYLERTETVHHKNGIRGDNRPVNLELRIGGHGAGATHCRHCGMVL